MRLILASGSPRRKQILTEFGFDFEVVVSGAEEKCDLKQSAEKIVENLAFLKADAVLKSVLSSRENEDFIVLGCDTVVVFDGKILGKPQSALQAKKTLKMLSGNKHQVISGYAILSKDKKILGHEITEVWFNELNDRLIDEYVATKSPMDKAGAYGIQDGFGLVKKIEGSYFNVVGLPIEKIEKELKVV